MRIAGPLAEIARLRGSQVMVLAASHLRLDLLPALYDGLRQTGSVPRLDVVLHGRGGEVIAARRLALLLREFTPHLAFIVPYVCESAATIMTLAADEVVAGPLAIFSPVDPSLHAAGSSDDQAPAAVSVQDVRLFGEMGRAWFGLDAAEANQRALSVLSENVFPTTLTAFYRAALEAREICDDLLSRPQRAATPETRARIVEQLLFGYHSHGYAITGDELAALGLPVTRDHAVEALAWDVSTLLQSTLGGGVRASEDDDWLDAIIVTSGTVRRRRRATGGLVRGWDITSPE